MTPSWIYGSAACPFFLRSAGPWRVSTWAHGSPSSFMNGCLAAQPGCPRSLQPARWSGHLGGCWRLAVADLLVPVSLREHFSVGDGGEGAWLGCTFPPSLPFPPVQSYLIPPHPLHPPHPAAVSPVLAQYQLLCRGQFWGSRPPQKGVRLPPRELMEEKAWGLGLLAQA